MAKESLWEYRLDTAENCFPIEMHLQDSSIHGLFWRLQLKPPRIKFYCSIEWFTPANSHYNAFIYSLIGLFSKQELSVGKVLFSCLRLSIFKILKRILNSAKITTFFWNSQFFSRFKTGWKHKTRNRGNYMMFFFPPLTHLPFFFSDFFCSPHCIQS